MTAFSQESFLSFLLEILEFVGKAQAKSSVNYYVNWNLETSGRFPVGLGGIRGRKSNLYN